MVNKYEKNGTNNTPFLLLALCLNIILVIVTASIILDFFSTEDGIVSGSNDDRVDGNPTGLMLDTAGDALTSANDQLEDMMVGNIWTIDSDDEYFHAICYRDYGRGDIIYWELEDENTTVYIRADNAEIILYEHTGWVPGSISESQALSAAETIAEQFATIPTDSKNADATWLDSIITYQTLDDQGNTDELELYSYWEVTYIRLKDNIDTSDEIRILLLPNGYLSLYSKTWNMNLISFSTSYSVSEYTAENIASTYIGAGSTVEDTFKLIDRPNNFYGSDLEYGNPPTCVWVVLVCDDDDNLWIIEVDGNSSLIVGGDATQDYYE